MMDNFQDNRLRILIADYEEAMLRLYQEMLSYDLFDLVICHQGYETVKAVKKAIEENRPFAVAFLDIQMYEGADNLFTSSQIRRLDPFMEVVIVTDDIDTLPRWIARSVSLSNKLLYLQKPFNSYEIRQIALSLGTRWLENRELRNRIRELKKQIENRTAESDQINKQLKQEIGKRRQTQAVLRECRDIFYSFMKYHPGPAFIKNHEGRYIYMNNACQKPLGIKAEDHIGKTDDDLWSPEAARAIKANDRLVMSRKKCLNILETFKTGEEIRHFMVSKFPILKNGKPFFLAGTATDITDRIRAEKTRHKLRDKIRSHNSRIIDTCEMALSKPRPEQADCLETILTSARALRKLIREVFDISGTEIRAIDFEKILFLQEDEQEIREPDEPLPSPPDTIPDDLPGLNIQEAVNRLGGSWDLYKDLFLFFCEDKKDFARDFREMIEKEDFETALITAHALKGSAATISANDLSQVAKDLEHVCKTKDKEKILGFLEPVAEALNHVILCCERIPELSEKKPDEPSENRTGSDSSEITELFRRFDRSLRESDPLESECCLNEIETSCGPFNDPEIETLLQNLARQTSVYNFDEAREILNQIARRLKLES